MAAKPRQILAIAPVLRVADLERALDFYVDKLGFALAFNFEDDYAGVERDGCPIHLKATEPLEPDEDVLAEDDEEEEDEDELIDACVIVADAAALAATFAAAGVEFTVPLRTVLHGREFYLRDPDGHVLAFVELAG